MTPVRGHDVETDCLPPEPPTLMQVLRANSRWFALAAALFFVSAVVMHLTPRTGHRLSDAILDTQMEGLERLIDIIMGLPPVAAALLVFVNNLISMVQMMLLGFIAALSPILTLCLNGMLVGVVTAMPGLQGADLLRMVAVTLLPHGIFELAAFFLSGGIGLKFGFHVTLAPLPGCTRKQSFKIIWREIWIVMPLLTLLVLIAAFVEIFVTGQLANRFISPSP
ncbi:stage II sporulation protein M [Desulfatitalea alkaliphila]|uniref:Stage II sporulation protein M n=1 Tax=Desulfatitalea alkaliphila TaxID=2929485 RepID=A0AA41R709_9BACT|nr:stage II sporulation protein M [Desulfatitalea alkaliphila]MCJ8502866.1 stage II sporulation protein M [Desulfatitalea alkaliphila]